MGNIEDRRCKKCGEVKPIGQFERRTGGWRHECNACRVAERAEMRRILSRMHAPEPTDQVDERRSQVLVINAFWNWYGWVYRSAPLAWSIGTVVGAAEMQVAA